MDDLFKALQIYGQGVQQFQMGRSIQGANQAVQQIRASDENEAKKRAQLQEVANSLTLSLASQGIPATTIQAVAGAAGPEKVANAEEAFIKAGLAPSADQADLYEKAGKAALEAKTAEAIAIQKVKNEAAMDLAGLKGTYQEKVATVKAGQKSKELDKASNAILVDNTSLVSSLNDLEDSVNGMSNFDRIISGNVGGARARADLAKLKTQVKTTVANYMNSTTGKQATDVERKDINDYIGQMEAAKTKEAFLAPFSVLRKLATNKVSALADTLEPQGKDVTGIRNTIAGYTRKPKNPLPPGVPAGSVRVKARHAATGKMVDAWKAPDGKLYKE